MAYVASSNVSVAHGSSCSRVGSSCSHVGSSCLQFAQVVYNLSQVAYCLLKLLTCCSNCSNGCGGIAKHLGGRAQLLIRPAPGHLTGLYFIFSCLFFYFTITTAVAAVVCAHGLYRQMACGDHQGLEIGSNHMKVISPYHMDVRSPWPHGGKT